MTRTLLRRICQFVLVGALPVLLFVASPSDPASAQACYSRVCLDAGSTPDPVVYAGGAFTFGGGGSRVVPTGSSVFAGCNWDLLEEGEELLIVRPDVASINITGSTFDEDHWVIYCPALNGFDAYTIFPVGDPPPVPIILEMIGDAYAQTPVVAFNPITSPNGDDAIPLITQMTTFLWVDETAWATPVTATISLPLPIAPFSVTTTAQAREAYWSGGDEPTWCSGEDMHPYVFGIGGDDAQPSNCSMVYRRSSALQDNTVDLEVLWDVSYSCSIPVCGGPLPDITTTSNRSVLVGEIQAVET